VLLPSDDRDEYAAFLGNFERELEPVGQLECELVQILIDCHWRLRRIQELEYALYAHGERQFADAFAGEHEHDSRSMIVLQTHLTYQKDLRNLHLQEARIDRKRAKALTELNQLQSLRKQKEEPSQADTASESDSLSEADLFAALDAGYVPSSIAGTLKSQQPVRKDGFVFSNSREQPSPSAAEPSDPAVIPRDRAA
jgi:hypothetical protein